jgi:hypothetical protein
LTPHVSNTNNKFIVRVGLDADGDGALNHGDYGTSEIALEATVYVVKIEDMFAWDAALPANIVTATKANPNVDLLVMETAQGDARVTLDVTGRPQTSDAGSHVLWRIEGAAVTAPESGNFGAHDPTITLTPSQGNRKFLAKIGFDHDANGVLDVAEVERTIDIFLVPKLHVQATAFIKQQWLADPIDGSVIWGGDDRIDATGAAVYSRSSTSFRLRQIASFIPLRDYDTDGLEDGSAQNLPGLTTKYNANVLVGGGLPPDAVPIASGIANLNRMQVDAIRHADRVVRARFRMEANNPLVTGSPDIELFFDLMIDYSDPRAPRMKIEGERGIFPCFDVFVNDQQVLSGDSGGNGVSWLIRPKAAFSGHWTPIH